MSSEVVNIIISRTVRPGHEHAFEECLRGWIPQAIKFPGHLGVLIVTPAAFGREYGAILRFRSINDWEAFAKWHEYQAFLGKVRPMLESEPDVHAVHGLEAWFPAATGKPVPRWKMALVTFLGVDIVAGVLTFAIKPLMVSQPVLGFFVFNGLVVVGLTWLVMPVLTKLTRAWLNQQ